MSAKRDNHPVYEREGAHRVHVPEDCASWTVPFPSYADQVKDYTAAAVRANMLKPEDSPGRWADGPTPDYTDRKTLSSGELRPVVDVLEMRDGVALNPSGRTGTAGRGLLGKWGPNFAADPIVTRIEPGTGELQCVAIQRRDTGEWALPGGMVDAGEAVSVTVRREFEEEAGAFEGEPAAKMRFRALVDDLFTHGVEVYRGYVDDPRNTDHAWMETTAFHFHCDAELGALLPLKAGDDAAAVQWIRIDPADDKYRHLYGNHRKLVDAAAARLVAPPTCGKAAFTLEQARAPDSPQAVPFSSSCATGGVSVPSDEATLEAEIAELEAINARMEVELRLDKRPSFNAAGAPEAARPPPRGLIQERLSMDLADEEATAWEEAHEEKARREAIFEDIWAEAHAEKAAREADAVETAWSDALQEKATREQSLEAAWEEAHAEKAARERAEGELWAAAHEEKARREAELVDTVMRTLEAHGGRTAQLTLSARELASLAAARTAPAAQDSDDLDAVAGGEGSDGDATPTQTPARLFPNMLFGAAMGCFVASLAAKSLWADARA